MSDFLGSLVSTAAPYVGAAAAIGGALIASNANKTAAGTVAAGNDHAAEISADSQQKARDAFAAAAARGVGDISAGTADFANTISPILSQSAVTLPTYRGLTEQQQIGLSDQQRGEQATLASSGLRGAGRAGVAAAMDADSRYTAAAHAGNDADTIVALRNQQATQNQARTGLAQIQAQAGGAKANTEIGAGNQIGASLQSQGSTAAGLVTNTALNSGASDIATGKTFSNTLGTVAALGNSPNSANGGLSSNYSGGYGDVKSYPAPDTGWQNA